MFLQSRYPATYNDRGKVKDSQRPGAGGLPVQSLADAIAFYLLERMGEADVLEVQRSELSARFGCSPSQVTYVLATRFRPAAGYVVESRRGGAGFIRIVRLRWQSLPRLVEWVERQIGNSIDQRQAEVLLARLGDEGWLSEREGRLLRAVMDRRVLALPLPERDRLRARLLRAALWSVLGLPGSREVAGGDGGRPRPGEAR